MSRRSISYRIIIFYLYFGGKEVLGLFCHKQALGSNKDNVGAKPATIVNKKIMKMILYYDNIQIQQAQQYLNNTRQC